MMQCPKNFPAPLIVLDETNSTSLHLRTLCQQSAKPTEEFTTVAASYQWAGRGQRGSSWESEAGQNLLFSTVLYPRFLEARQQFLLSQIVSLSIKEVLDTFTDGISIKWPNDIYWKEKKIAGILIENELMGDSIQQSIAGIGININQQSFISPAPNPVSLRQITGKEYQLSHILRLVILRLKANYELLRRKETEQILNLYQNALFRKRGLYSFRDSTGVFKAEIVRVEPDGTLFLKDNTGNVRKFTFKEVEYLLD